MIKTIIIGCGRMGERHIQAVQAMDELTLTGVADANADNLKNCGDTYDIGENALFSDFGEMLSATSPELVIIATTATPHHALTIQAAKASVKYILCEKPMAVSIAQAEEMVSVCKEHNVHLAINHPVRFTEADIAMKELLTSEKMGGVNAVHISAGNFGLAMNVSHNIEMFRFLTDEPLITAQGWFDKDTVPNPRGPQFEDRSGQLRMTSKSGKTMTINANANNGHGIFVTYAARYGQVALNVLTGDALVTYRKDEFRERPTTQYGLPAENQRQEFKSSDLVVRCQKTLRALIAENDYPDGQTVVRTIEILAAAYHSHENNNCTVNVETDDLPKERIFPWA